VELVTFLLVFVAFPLALGLGIRWVWRRGERESVDPPHPMQPFARGDGDEGPTIPLLPGDHPSGN